MADLTSLGVELGYALASTNGTKPTAFTMLPRCKKIGGIELSQEKIDVSTLEDLTTKYAKGRQDTGGEWEVTFHSGGLAAVKEMMAAATAAPTKEVWFEVYVPTMEDAFFVVAQPGEQIPLPDMDDNSALEFPIKLTINEYKGMSTAVAPTAAD